MSRSLNVLLLVFVLLFVLVPAVAAQDDVPGSPTTEELLGPVIAVAVGVKAFVDFLKPQVRKTKFSTEVQDTVLLFIAVAAGIVGVFMTNGFANLFPDAPLKYQPVALILTGVIASLGAEFIHVVAGFLYAGRNWLRVNAVAADNVTIRDELMTSGMTVERLRRNTPVPPIGKTPDEFN